MTTILIARAGPETEAAEEALRAAGLDVAGAEAGGDLLARARERRPALLVLDGASPEAAARCEALRAEPDLADVAIAWMGEPGDEPVALSLGATVVVARPLEASELAAVAAALDDPGVRREMDRALAALRARRPDRAAEVLQELAGRASGALAAICLHLLGHVRLAQGQAQSAAEDFHAAAEEDAVAWRAHVQLAALHGQAGYEGEAAEHRDLARRARQALAARRPAAAGGRHSPRQNETMPISREELEAVRAAAAASRARQESAEPPAPGTVLIADDSELALGLLQDALEEAGHRVLTARDGREALELAAAERPDVLVLDGLMPGATGFEVCQRVKGEILAGAPPVVLILSAIYTKQRQRTEGMREYGADDVLRKTSDLQEVVEAVGRHLRARRGG